MYCRKTSSGSSPTRSARRLAAALTRPELVRASVRASIASSIASGSTTSSQSSSAGGTPASNSRPERMAWRARRAPTERGSRSGEAPGMIPSFRAGRKRRQPRAAITWSITWSSWQAPPLA